MSSVIEKQGDVTGCLADTYDGAHRSQFYELGQVGYDAMPCAGCIADATFFSEIIRGEYGPRSTSDSSSDVDAGAPQRVHWCPVFCGADRQLGESRLHTDCPY